MTEQIAPSLATELEQAEQYERREALECREQSSRYRSSPIDGGHSVRYCEQLAERHEFNAALLTRASALARAAEKVKEPIAMAQDEMYQYCVVCGGAGDYDGATFRRQFKPIMHRPDCAWMQLRALVSSAGKGE